MSTSGPERQVAVINPLDLPSWDADLAAAFPDASPFFQSAWARVLESTYGYAPLYIVEREANRLHTVLPMMEVRSWLTGTRGVSLPFTDECEALGQEPGDNAKLYQKAVDLGRSRKWAYVELRGTRTENTEATPSVSFYGHQLKLDPNPTALLPGFDSSVRRAIRKAETEGVTVELNSSLEGMRTFYQLLCRTRRRHGLPPQPFAFFQQIHRCILAPGKGITVLAKWNNLPIAGAVFFRAGSSALYKFGASDDTHQHRRGNNAVMWKAIEHFARAGCTHLDFGRTSVTNEGLRRFKLSWGAAERTIDYFRYDLRANRFIMTPDQAAGGLHTRVFRALPLGISRLFGALAYKHLG